MARNKRNNLTRGISGKIGEVVFTQREGKTIIGKQRVNPEYATLSQQAVRDYFRKASIYAKGAVLDPVLEPFYRSKARKGRSAYQTALTDYLKPCIIHEIDAAAYDGTIGSKLRIGVSSIGRVVSLKVRIESANGSLIEEGSASIAPGAENGYYTATAANNNLAGSVIKVTAKDLPGHLSSNSLNL